MRCTTHRRKDGQPLNAKVVQARVFVGVGGDWTPIGRCLPAGGVALFPPFTLTAHQHSLKHYSTSSKGSSLNSLPLHSSIVVASASAYTGFLDHSLLTLLISLHLGRSKPMSTTSPTRPLVEARQPGRVSRWTASFLRYSLLPVILVGVPAWPILAVSCASE